MIHLAVEGIEAALLGKLLHVRKVRYFKNIELCIPK